jgi:crotonobetainyl-CoA:carnitine CoA-transferase CaiB-like acyl-CoA transferase
LTALEHRDRTGEGAFIDAGMLEPCASQLGEAILRYSMTGQATERAGNRDPNAAPSGCYRCRGADKWVAIAAATEAQWRALVGLLGNPPWAADARFSTLASRRDHHDELDRHLEAWTLERENREVMRLCQEAGVPAGAVLNIAEVMTNEQLLHRGAFELVQHPPPPDNVGKRLHIGPPWKLSKAPTSTVIPAADRLGRDNDIVYRGLLGLTEEEMSALDKEGVISTELKGDPRTILIPPEYFGDCDEDFMKRLGLE